MLCIPFLLTVYQNLQSVETTAFLFSMLNYRYKLICLVRGTYFKLVCLSPNVFFTIKKLLWKLSEYFPKINSSKRNIVISYPFNFEKILVSVVCKVQEHILISLVSRSGYRIFSFVFILSFPRLTSISIFLQCIYQ